MTFHWWQTGVIYQIYPRSFKDSNGDGIGDLAGVLGKLDYLQRLGIDAIWFSPLFPSPQADFGYDVADYTDIHSEYGTLADMDRIIEESHKRDIRVILDLVPNHTSSEHAWFKESRSSRDNPKRDWYIWKDPAPDGGPPNNWINYFNGEPAWTFDEKTGQYYLHNFHPGQPDLNWRNPQAEHAMFDVIRFWLNRGIDGFRMDVIDRILKDPEFRDNPPNPDWKPGDPPAGRLQRIYSERHTPELHEYMRRFRSVFDEFAERVSIGEVAYDLTREQLASFYGDLRDNGQRDELHLPFNFELITLPWEAPTIRRAVEEYEHALPEHAWPNYVLGNHDMPRLASRVGQAQARVAAVMLLTLRGTPTLYYGDEIGMENVPVPEDRILDPQGRGKGFNRDECRTPMQWDNSANAGFSDTDGDTWLPVAPDYETRNVAVQNDDPNSLLSLYRRLLDVRRRQPVLARGSYRSLKDVPDGCFAYVREYEGQRYLVLLNFNGDDCSVSAGEFKDGSIILSTHSGREDLKVDLAGFELRGDEGVIIEID